MIDPLLANPFMRAGAPIMINKDQVGGRHSRERLSRWWGNGRRLPWILLNPSIGDDQINDPTILRIIHFTWLWGFDGFDLFNVYPFRTPKPSVLAQTVVGWSERQDWGLRDDVWRNHNDIAKALVGSDAAMVAWGSPSGRLAEETALWVEHLFDTINDDLGPRNYTLKLWCLGKSQSGGPTHPMARGKHRVPDDSRPIRFANPGTIELHGPIEGAPV